MKSIIENSTNLSLYVFDDDEVVNIQDDKTSIGDPATLYIADCNSSNVTLIENVTPPDDWCGRKYFYTPDNGWVMDSNWIDPNPSISE